MQFFKNNRRNFTLEEFVRTQREKTLAFLHKNFGMSTEDCEDVFQESFIVLYENIHKGKLNQMTASVSTYFNAICRNKAMEQLRTSRKYIHAQSEIQGEQQFSDEKVEILLSLHCDDAVVIEEKEKLVRNIVRNLPPPCDELLWGYYRDGLSMKTLAHKFGYSSENSAKVTKHRCCEKFRNRFNELLHTLY